MAYSPTMVSNNILTRAFAEKIDVTPMKLQKLLYFIASEYAKRTGKPLLATSFQVWQYGPVVRSVFDEFRPFSKSAIKQYGKDSTGRAYQVDLATDPDLQHVIEQVWNGAKYMNAVTLSRITHEPGSGWSRANDEGRPLISDEELKADTTYQQRLGLATAQNA